MGCLMANDETDLQLIHLTAYSKAATAAAKMVDNAIQELLDGGADISQVEVKHATAWNLELDEAVTTTTVRLKREAEG